jgi:REP element-mobilizing transposase RayT
MMPNHVHVLIAPTAPLGKIVQSWKSYTGRWARMHAAELGIATSGEAFWMREYWDRYIRDEGHYRRAVDYIHRNPVVAGLCATPEGWRWSSAGYLQTA